ncbi:MAG: hypothetical protein ACJ71Y_16130 [Blastococcus sp.]
MSRTSFGRGRPRIGVMGWALRGAAAGAAGTTALDLVTYLDMTVRGRPSSSTPERTVEKLAEKAHLTIPGQGVERASRLEGLGALTSLVVGVGIGGLLGLARASGLRAGTLLTTVTVLVSTNGAMTVLRVTDPRTWSAADWLSDLVPHLAYAAVVTTTMDALDRP